MKMSKGFYRQLAKTNMKKNGKIYTPYILSVIAAVAMFYIIQQRVAHPQAQFRFLCHEW